MMIRVLSLLVLSLGFSEPAPVTSCAAGSGTKCYIDYKWTRPGHAGLLVTGLKNHLPDTNITASSQRSSHYAVVNARINNKAAGGGWLYKSGLSGQWIQFDFGKPWTIVGIVTIGSSVYGNWVKSYEVKYAETECDKKANNWIPVIYKTASELGGATSVFPGNWDRDTAQVHMLLEQFSAQYIRIFPKTFYTHATMRADILGCFEDE